MSRRALPGRERRSGRARVPAEPGSRLAPVLRACFTLILLAASIRPGLACRCDDPPLIITADKIRCVHVGDSVTFTVSGEDKDPPTGAVPPNCEPETRTPVFTWGAEGATPDHGTGSTFVTKWETPGADRWVIVSADDTGSAHEEGPTAEAWKVTAWDATIDKCAPAWLPAYGNTTTITATLAPTGLTANFEFTLSDVSSRKGICCNSGTQTDADLKILAQDGWNTYPDGAHALTTQPIGGASLVVSCFDYGAYGKIKCDVQLSSEAGACAGAKATAHVAGSAQTTVVIPLDDDNNHIADGWGYNSGDMYDDEDTTPTGVNTGDGFYRFDEYRGFMLGGNHIRTDPDVAKDVFVYDRDGLGLGDFGALGLTIHTIADSEWESSTRKVDFCEKLSDQCGMELEDGGYLNATTMGMVSAVGTPNACEWARIYTDHVRECCGPTYDRVTWDALDIECKNRCIGHELGHYAAIAHHTTGTVGCVLHEPCPTSPTIPHAYCTASPGCATRSQLH